MSFSFNQNKVFNFSSFSENTKNTLKNYLPWVYKSIVWIKKRFYTNSRIKNRKNYTLPFKPYEVKILKPILTERKKILHVIANFWTGGSARLVVDLVEHLGHQYEQKVITRDIPSNPSYIGIPIIVNKELVNPKQFLLELNNFKPDIIHVHYLGHHRDKWGELDWKWYDNCYKAIEKYNYPVIQNINIPTEPYNCNLVKRYVYVSKYVEKKYGQAHHQNTVIYPGSNFTHFNRSDLSDIPDNCIGMVYRLERDKINEDSIKVFIEIVKKRKGTQVLIVGGGSLLDDYKKTVDAAGVMSSFTFTGYVSYNDLPFYFRKMSIFIAPVHTESFGQVTPMAMNMGIPVAGYHVGAIPEILKDESTLVPSGDYKKLSQIVVQLLNDREMRLKIGVANHIRAKELYSVFAMIRSYQEIYSEVI